ncbi:hypothetical protein D3C72_1734410 [compost metagenome]
MAASGQGCIGNACLDVGQPHLAPLANDVAITVGQGAVVWPGDCRASLFQGNSVVGRNFSGEADGAFGKARTVIEDGALHPVIAAVSVMTSAIAFVVLPERRAGGTLAGVPVAGRAGKALALDKACGFALSTGALDGDRNNVLADGFGLGHDGQPCDGQGQYGGCGSSQGKAPFHFFFC